jgi:hypothetical protein
LPALIAVLLALTAALSNHAPLHQMTEAEPAEQGAAADLALEVNERLDTTQTLSNENREMIFQNARNALACSQLNPETEGESWAMPGRGRCWKIDRVGDHPCMFGDS